MLTNRIPSSNLITFLCISILWLLLIFLINPHYIELTGVLETWFLSRGLVYYKDFAAYHFPLGRLILLPVHLLSNWNLELDPLVGLVMGIGTLIVIYMFGRRFLTPIATSISLIFFSVFFWFVATGVLFFHEIMIGFLIALIIFLLFQIYNDKKISSKKNLILGIFISLTELTGQIVTLTLIAILFVSSLHILKNKSKRIVSISSLIIGLVIPFVLLSIYFLAKNALGEFYFYNLNYYLYYANYQKDSFFLLPLIELFTFYLPLFILGIFAMVNTLRKKLVEKNILLILTISVSTIPAIFFSIYHQHHLNYVLPILAITAGFAYDYSKKFNQLGKKVFIVGATYFFVIFFCVILNWHLSRFVYPPNFKIGNDLYRGNNEFIINLVELIKRKIILLFVPEEIANFYYFQDTQIKTPYVLYTDDNPIYSTVSWLKENTTNQTKIMVMGDPIVYLRSNRLPSARPSKSIPYGWEPTLIKREIENNRPDYWVISRQFLRQLVDNNNRPDIVDFVSQELKNCYFLRIENQGMEIWQKRCN